MQNELMSTLLREDHQRLVARLKTRPMDDIVLARLSDRGRRRGLVLAAAMVLGATIAAVELLAFQPRTLNGPGMIGFMIAFVVIAGTICATGRAIAD